MLTAAWSFSRALARACFVICCLTQAVGAAADTVLFRNNDRLTGKALEVTNRTIAFDNPSVGRVTIPWDAVQELRSMDRWEAEVPRTSPHSAMLKQFHQVVLTVAGGTLVLQLDSQAPRQLSEQTKIVLADEAEPSPSPAPAPPPVPVATPKRPPSAIGHSNSRWVLNINAPESITAGTENQLTWGGTLIVDIFEGKRNHTRLAAAGTHDRSWELGSPFITTDTFDSFLQQSHSFGTKRGGVFGNVETFINTSLGVALQQSYGAGLYSRNIIASPFEFKGSADIRYFNQRLYGAAKNLNLAGSRFEGQAIYRKMDPVEAGKVKYLVIAKAWVNPMWNNEQALQGYGTLQLGVPFGHFVCLSFSPVEDNYVRNAPGGHRKNYFSSSVGLKIERGSDPKQNCY